MRRGLADCEAPLDFFKLTVVIAVMIGLLMLGLSLGCSTRCPCVPCPVAAAQSTPTQTQPLDTFCVDEMGRLTSCDPLLPPGADHVPMKIDLPVAVIPSPTPNPNTLLPDLIARVRDPRDGWDGRCPECVKEGQKSTVTCGPAWSTEIYCGNGSYDEEGYYHGPKPCNTSTSTCTCSRGHEFKRSWPSY